MLSTKWLSYEEVIRLKAMEEMVEVYYNSGQFTGTMKLLEKEFRTPSEMFLALAEYYETNGLFGFSHSRIARYEILYRFLAEKYGGGQSGAAQILSAFRDSLIYDLYLRENVEFFEAEAKQPVWLTGYDGYDSRQISKMAHLEALEDGSYVLFDYRNRDPLSGNARAVRLKYHASWEGGKV